MESPGRSLTPRVPARSRTRGTLVGLVALVGLAVWSGLAVAHPFGPPPRVWMAVEDQTVSLAWEAAYDDHLMVGEHLGHLEPGLAEAALDPSVEVAPPRSDMEELAASDELHGYLEDNLAVEQDGRRCDPEIVTTESFAAHGARTHHHCPEAVGEVTVRVSMMHDINEAYRTFGMAEDGPAEPLAIFTVAEPEHRLTVDELGTGGAGRGSRLVLLGALVAVATATTVAFRRLRGSGRAS